MILKTKVIYTPDFILSKYSTVFYYYLCLCVQKTPGEGNGNLLQNSCLGNPMD